LKAIITTVSPLTYSRTYRPPSFLKLGYNAVLQSSKSNDIPGGIIYNAFTAAPVVPVFMLDGSYGDPNDFPVGNIPITHRHA
jgi:hypothetical protein